MQNNKLYIICPACEGHGSRKYEDSDTFDSQLNMPPPFCIVCDGVGFIESGLHTGQVNSMQDKLDRIRAMAYQLTDSPMTALQGLGNAILDILRGRVKSEVQDA